MCFTTLYKRLYMYNDFIEYIIHRRLCCLALISHLKLHIEIKTNERNKSYEY
jgi:hypothetical protein